MKSLTIAEYATQKREGEKLTLKTKKKPHFQLVVGGEVHMFPYDDPSQISPEYIVLAVRSRFQLSTLNPYVCNTDGIISFPFLSFWLFSIIYCLFMVRVMLKNRV